MWQFLDKNGLASVLQIKDLDSQGGTPTHSNNLQHWYVGIRFTVHSHPCLLLFCTHKQYTIENRAVMVNRLGSFRVDLS